MRRKRFVKRILALFLVVFVSFGRMPSQWVYANAWSTETATQQLGLRFYKDEKPNYRFYLNAGERYILETVKTPKVGSTYGEWSVLDLLRGMYTGMDYINEIPDTYFQDYLTRVEEYVVEKNGILDRSKSTEWSRLMLTLTAMGQDVTAVAGEYDFIQQLSKSYAFSYKQGINGPIWEIIAMHTGDYAFYETPEEAEEGDENTYGKMLDYILDCEITQENGIKGGFALTANVPDPDITAMAVQAFAPFYLNEDRYEQSGCTRSYEEFCEVVERAVCILSQLQLDNGGYESWGSINSESTGQVIVALTALGIDPLSNNVVLPHIQKSCSFQKAGAVRDGVYTDNMLDALLSFYAAGSGSSAAVGGFKHVTAGYDGGGNSGVTVNAMATDQAVYALIAYDRFLQGKNALYDMTDQMDGSYTGEKAIKYEIAFDEGNGVITKQQVSPYGEVHIGAATGEQAGSFVGWNTNADGSGVTYLPGEVLSMPEKNIVLYAQYGAQEFSVTWDLGNGSYIGEQPLPQTYTTNSKMLLPTAEQMKQDGCVFVGWYTDPTFTGKAVEEIPIGTYGNQKFYAHFEVDWAPINAFYEQMSKLDLGQLTTADTELVANARGTYDSMAQIQKDEVLSSTYEKLQAAEQMLQEILEKNGETMPPVLITKTPSMTKTPSITNTPVVPKHTENGSQPQVSEGIAGSQEPVQTENAVDSNVTSRPDTSQMPQVTQLPAEKPSQEVTQKPIVSLLPTSTVLSGTEQKPEVTQPSVTEQAMLQPEKTTSVESVIASTVQPQSSEIAVSENENLPNELSGTAEPVSSEQTTKIELSTLVRPTVVITYQKKKQQIVVKIKKSKEKQLGGYELVYATNRAFTKKKKVVRMVAGKNILKNWKKKQAYYFKVRAYGTDLSGRKIYSRYSKVIKIPK